MPRRFAIAQLVCFEAIRQLLIGSQSYLSLSGSGANQWDTKLIGQIPEGVQENPLLAIGAGQKSVGLRRR